MAFNFTILILPALVVANIKVQLSGKYKGDTSKLKLSYNGNNIGIITDTEMNTFNLDEDILKNAVSLISGKSPDDLYLRSPTPWHDLYRSFGWEQVSRTLRPITGEILKISSKPSIIHQQIFTNNKRTQASLDVGISKKIQNTVSSSWKTEGQISIVEQISYGIGLEIVEAGEEISFSFNSPWSKDIKQWQNVRVGTTSPLEIILEPNQSVIAQLRANMVNIEILMEYEASLNGQVAVNYAEKYEDRHFWSHDISHCMKLVGLSNQKLSREIIDIIFYVDSEIIVQDNTNGSTLMLVTF